MTEQEIIYGCLKGREAAFKALVDIYSPMLMAVVIRYMKYEQHSQDVLQESLIKICKNIDKYQNTGSFKNWMITITINTCLKEIQKYKLIEDIDFAINEVYQGDTPIENLLVDDIISEINKMPDIHRIVFNLNIIEGYSHAEIAEKLNIKESSSRVFLARARNFLRININQFENSNSHE